MSNPFAQFAEDTKPAWKDRKERTVATRRERALAKRDTEQSEIDRVASAWRRARLEQLKDGPYGTQIKALRSFLRTMTLDSAPGLIALVAGSPWLHECDRDTQYDVFDMISRGITSLRLRNGMTPFDDPLPPETNAFLTIREQLYGY